LFPQNMQWRAAVGCHIFAAEKPCLAARKSPETHCLQFAARHAGGVNVPALRESQTDVKYFTQRWISCRTIRRLTRASPSNARQAIEQAS
jgi:hypothetical protein